VLNLNHNNLQNEHAYVLADMLKDSSLKMLFIAWNKIRDKGAMKIFEALAENTTLQVFDGSFNSFSSNSISALRHRKQLDHESSSDSEDDKISHVYDSCESAKALSKMFVKNTSLIHIDLSHNNFSSDD